MHYQYVIDISATVGFPYLDLDKNWLFNLLILGSETDYNINFYFGVVNMLLEVLSAFGRGPSETDNDRKQKKPRRIQTEKIQKRCRIRERKTL